MAHMKIPIIAVKLILYYTGNSEIFVITILLARICVHNQILIDATHVLLRQFVHILSVQHKPQF